MKRKIEDIMTRNCSIFIRLCSTRHLEKLRKYREVNSKIFQGKFDYPKSNSKTYIFNRDIYGERGGGEREEKL